MMRTIGASLTISGRFSIKRANVRRINVCYMDNFHRAIQSAQQAERSNFTAPVMSETVSNGQLALTVRGD
jgi:hypothetical protein